MRALILLLATLPAWGALVTITDTLKTPMAGTFSGRVTIALAGTSAQPLYNSSGDTLTGWETTVTVTNGVFSIQLEANDTITPAGTSYRVRMIPANGTKETLEMWIVPTSASPLKVATLRSSTIPTPTVMISPQQISSGGAVAGQGLVYSGTSWGPAYILLDPATTLGDMHYRGAGGATRLPIGSAGQVLGVSAGLPAWIAPPACATCVVTGGSYADPAWITSLAGAKITGAVATATLAASATALATPRNIAGVSFNGTANIAIPSTGLSDTADLIRGVNASITKQSGKRPLIPLWLDTWGFFLGVVNAPGTPGGIASFANGQGELTVSGAAAASTLTVSAVVVGVIGDYSGTFAAVIEHDDGSYYTYTCHSAGPGTVSIYPSLRSTVTTKKLNNLYDAANGQHLTARGYTALAWWTKQQVKRYAIKQKVGDRLAWDASATKYGTDFTGAGGLTTGGTVSGSTILKGIINSDNNIAGDYGGGVAPTNADRSYITNDTRHIGVGAGTAGEGATKSATLGGRSGFFEAYVAVAGQKDSGTPASAARVKVWIDGALQYSQAVYGLTRVLVPFDRAWTSVFEVTLEASSPTHIKISRPGWYFVDEAYMPGADESVVTPGSSIGFLMDSWGTYYSNAYPTGVASAMSADTEGPVFRSSNVSVGGTTAIWGEANYASLLGSFFPDYVIVDFEINDYNGGRTEAQILADLQALSSRIIAYGATPVILFNIQTSSFAQSQSLSIVGRHINTMQPTSDTAPTIVALTSSLSAIASSGSASDLSTGTLAAARGGAGTINGLMKANGSGVVSAAVSGTDYAPPIPTVTSGALLFGQGTGVPTFDAARLGWNTATGYLSVSSTDSSSGQIRANSSTASGYGSLAASNNVNDVLLVGMYGSTASDARAAFLYAGSNATSLRIWTNDSTSPIRFLVGGSERGRFAPTTGAFLLGTTTDDGSNRFQINGNMRIGGAAEPTCAVGVRGTLAFVAGGAGVKDTLRICRKDAADAYAWEAIY